MHPVSIYTILYVLHIISSLLTAASTSGLQDWSWIHPLTVLHVLRHDQTEDGFRTPSSNHRWDIYPSTTPYIYTGVHGGT